MNFNLRKRQPSRSSKLRRVFESLEPRNFLAGDSGIATFHNSALPADVNNNGIVSAQDALLIINEISFRTLTKATGERSNDSNPNSLFLDVSGDSLVTAQDALMVINTISMLNSASGPSSLAGAEVSPNAILVGTNSGGVTVDEGASLTEQPTIKQNWGVNLNENVDFSSTSPWMDITKQFRVWGKPDAPWELQTWTKPFTNQGIPQEDFGAIIVNSGGGVPMGIYNLRFDGTATVTFTGGWRLVPDSVQKSGDTTTMQVEVTRLDDSSIKFSGVTESDPVRNMKMVSSLVDINTNEIFSQAFLDRLKPFSSLRFLDWNETNNSLVTSWDARRTVDQTIQTGHQPGLEGEGGVAWEYMIALANKTQTNPWINVPHLVDDHYIEELATLWRDNLDPNLTLYIEWSNETWNGRFAQSRGSDGVHDGYEYGLPENTGPQTIRISNIFHQVFGDQSDRLHITLAGQAENPDVIRKGLDYFKSLDLAPSSVIDSISIAPYFGVSANSKAATVDELFSELTQATDGIEAHATMANAEGIEMLAYEAGQHLAENLQTKIPVNVLKAAQNDPRMGEAYRDFAKAWASAGGGLINHFGLAQQYAWYGDWGLLDQISSPGDVKWDAVMSVVNEKGDANLDGVVDFADFTVLRDHFGQSSQWWEQGDFNGDRRVGSVDLQLLHANANLSSTEAQEIRDFAATRGVPLYDHYTLAMSSIPTSPVTITISPNAQLETSATSLTFEADASALIPRTIYVAAKNDVNIEGLHFASIHHTATSADINFQNITIPDVQITINDNDYGDTNPPTARVNPLTRIARSKTITLEVAASDPVDSKQSQLTPSGVASVDIFVARDDGPFEFFRSLPAGTTTTAFYGESGHTYLFHALAHDVSGNVEKVPVGGAGMEARTTVPDLDAPFSWVTSVDASDSLLNIDYSVTDSGGSGLRQIDFYVSVDGGPQTMFKRVVASGGSASGSVEYQASRDGVDHTYEFTAIGADVQGNSTAIPAPGRGDIMVSTNFVIPATTLDHFVISDGQTQRSRLRYMELQFNEYSELDEIIQNGLSLKAFGLDGQGAGQSVNLKGKVTRSGSSIRFDFGSDGIGGNRISSSGDGIYELTVDVNRNNVIETDEVFRFFRLFGDTTGDGIVDQADLNKFDALFQSDPLNLEGDVNGDGRLSTRDRSDIFSHLGRRITGAI